ncbi:MAG: hypothetical protein RLZZ383_1308 [Pseudomonadota bacterium]|jgi:DNA mismatch repair protein MutH
MRPPPPETVEVLRQRARRLAGASAEDLAAALGVQRPDPRRSKGWLGEAIERLLGAHAGNLPVPDFPALGVECKTLPVTPEGQPRESTYVTTAPLEPGWPRWDHSPVRAKLSHVLWVPIVATATGPRVGRAFLWVPTAAQEAVLASDWETFADVAAQGEHRLLQGRLGTALQVRPKGRNAADTAWVVDEEGERVRATRRGIYLRPAFTAAILSEALRVG